MLLRPFQVEVYMGCKALLLFLLLVFFSLINLIAVLSVEA